MTNIKSLEFVLNGLDSLIDAKEHHIGQKHSHVLTHEDTATVGGKKITFKDPSRKKAGKTAWADIKAHPQAWLNKHDKSHPWYSLVVQIRDKKRRQG